MHKRNQILAHEIKKKGQNNHNEKCLHDFSIIPRPHPFVKHGYILDLESCSLPHNIQHCALRQKKNLEDNSSLSLKLLIFECSNIANITSNHHHIHKFTNNTQLESFVTRNLGNGWFLDFTII